MNEHGQEIYLVRHGETEWSLSGQHTGSTDIPLTENGKEVARELGRKLAGHEFAAVWSSPMSRAIDTARLAGFDHDVRIDDRLKEWEYGDYEGLTTPQIRETRPDWFLWRDGCPGGELPEQVGARADGVIQEVKPVEGDVLLFAHGHILRVIAARWLRYPPNDGMHFSLGTATLSILGYEREATSIWRWNAP
ncbi:MAG TPA: histidine phosphatase family protein [Solirubrobacteraceae bacterium]|nr:histidine phosphatase family protein [Solirubrobacteraceae bacterium]